MATRSTFQPGQQIIGEPGRQDPAVQQTFVRSRVALLATRDVFLLDQRNIGELGRDEYAVLRTSVRNVSGDTLVGW